MKNLENNNENKSKSLNVIEKYFWMAVYFLSPIIPILFIYHAEPWKFGRITEFVSMAAGTTAFVWFVYEFVLVARPKFIERCFGLDKFYAFHGMMAIMSVLLVILHFYTAHGGRNERTYILFGKMSFLIYAGITGMALIFIASSFLLKIKIIARIKNFLAKYSIFKYHNQVLVHNVVLAAYILMFMHVILISVVSDDPATQTVFIVFFLIGLIFYIYHRFLKKILLRKRNFIVQAVINEGSNMWTINLTPEEGKIFSYKPGQFAYLKIYSDSVSAESHPYSISSSPLNSDFISFTIKELGDYTKGIGLIKVGDKAQIEGPFGRFSYVEYPKETGAVLIAGGVGITPNLAMLRYMATADKQKNVILFWGINSSKDLIVLNEFEDMQKQMKNFRFIPVMFKDDTWKGEKGIINKEKIERILNENKMDVYSCGYYICGPAVMTNGVVGDLKSMGIANKNIHFEKFSM